MMSVIFTVLQMWWKQTGIVARCRLVWPPGSWFWHNQWDVTFIRWRRKRQNHSQLNKKYNINIKTTDYRVEYSLIFSSILALFLLWLCRLWITSSYRLKFFLAFWTLIEFWPSRRVLYCLNKSLRSSDLWTCRVGLKLIWETEQHGKIKGK